MEALNAYHSAARYYAISVTALEHDVERLLSGFLQKAVDIKNVKDAVPYAVGEY